MTGIIEFLLGIDRIDLSDPGEIALRFLSPWPTWLGFLVLIGVVAYVWSIYRREGVGTPPAIRRLLAVLRCLIIVLTLLMILQPALVLLREEVIRSSVAVLVDGSSSMAIRDVPEDSEEREALIELAADGPGPSGRQAEVPSRWTQACAVLGQNGCSPLRRLAEKQRVYLYTFDEKPRLAARFDDPGAAPAALEKLRASEPEGRRTAPAECVRTVLRELSAQTLTGVVLLTDGRATANRSTKTLAEAVRARDVPPSIFGIGFGATVPPNDAWVARVSAERRAFAEEEVPVRLQVGHTGYDGRKARVKLSVNGHPGMGAERTITLGPPDRAQEVELRWKPEAAGTYRFTVGVEPFAGEFDEDNNMALPMRVEVIDRKLKVLLIEDLPRWEYQYLKDVLVRDPTVKISVLLHSADLLFAPEGDLPIEAFPPSREGLFEYDVIVLGDVHRRRFSQEQLEWMDAFVREKGGGLVFVAGPELYNPNSYAGTPLEDLLPVVLSDEQITGGVHTAFRPEVTAEGAVSPILRFERDLRENAETWRHLKGFYWYYRARRAKPGARVLLRHPTAENPLAPSGKYPIMALQRVGAGQVFFSASDETWRWRHYTGRRYFNAFWIQLVRHLALPQEAASVEADRLRYTAGETAALQFRVADRESIPSDIQQVRANVEWTSAGSGEIRKEEIILQRTDPELPVFEGEFTPRRSGRYHLRVKMQTTGEEVEAESDFLVTASREEFREPTRDPAFLEQIVGVAPGGEILSPKRATALAEKIPSRNRIVSNDLTDSIWDSPLALVLFIGIIGSEWILRKKYRML